MNSGQVSLDAKWIMKRISGFQSFLDFGIAHKALWMCISVPWIIRNQQKKEDTKNNM